MGSTATERGANPLGRRTWDERQKDHNQGESRSVGRELFKGSRPDKSTRETVSVNSSKSAFLNGNWWLIANFATPWTMDQVMKETFWESPSSSAPLCWHSTTMLRSVTKAALPASAYSACRSFSEGRSNM